MSTYAVGDVQGCYVPLCRLLERVGFDPAADQLWFAGDLVNRGPDSEKVLRLVASLERSARVVLGNHDLHLLAVAAGVRAPKRGDTLRSVLEASDAAELLGFLGRQPLLHEDPELGYCMVHAGIPPHWDLATARARAREAELFLEQHGYGACARVGDGAPRELGPELSAEDRVRVILGYLTRMRVCTPEGRVDLAFKGAPADAPPGYAPWFAHEGRKTAEARIVFGHWAALRGRADTPGVFALDTGCVWGDRLTLMRLDDGRRFSCECG